MKQNFTQGERLRENTKKTGLKKFTEDKKASKKQKTDKKDKKVEQTSDTAKDL